MTNRYELTAPNSAQARRFAFATLHAARLYLHGRDGDAADLLLSCQHLVKWGKLELETFWWAIDTVIPDYKTRAAGDEGADDAA